MTQSALIRRWEEELASYGKEKAAAFLLKGQRKGGLMYGDRAVCQALRPLFLARETYQILVRESQLLRSALGRLWRDFRADPAAFADLRFTAMEEELIALDAQVDHPDTFGRIDGILQKDGSVRFLEYNGESPGGLGYGDALGDLFESLPFFAKLQKEFGLTRCKMLPRVVNTYLNSWRQWCAARKVIPNRHPRVLILDLAGAPTIGEFRLFQTAFREAGCEVEIASPEDLHFNGTTLVVKGRPVDLVYRRLLSADLLVEPKMAQALLDALAADRVFCGNGFGGYFFAHKGLLAHLSDPQRRPLDLTPAELQSLASSLPWTRIAQKRARSTAPDGGGELQDLETIVLANAEQLVLKPAADYGGRDVVLGWRTEPEPWRSAWNRACEGRFIVQARIPLETLASPWQQAGEVRRGDFRFDLAPYVLGGLKVEGLGVRLSQDELLNVAAGGGSAVPAFLVG
ncbi:MAG: hypothetical protein V3W41_12040 [Planctomycetota bacterium]